LGRICFGDLHIGRGFGKKGEDWFGHNLLFWGNLTLVGNLGCETLGKGLARVQKKG